MGRVVTRGGKRGAELARWKGFAVTVMKTFGAAGETHGVGCRLFLRWLLVEIGIRRGQDWTMRTLSLSSLSCALTGHKRARLAEARRTKMARARRWRVIFMVGLESGWLTNLLWFWGQGCCAGIKGVERKSWKSIGSKC